MGMMSGGVGLLCILPRVWAGRAKIVMYRWLANCDVWFDGVVRISGPVYIAVALVLIVGIIYVYLSVVLPLYCSLTSPLGTLHLLTALWLAFNILFNYYCCITTDPGTPPNSLEILQESSSNEGPSEAGDSVKSSREQLQQQRREQQQNKSGIARHDSMLQPYEPSSSTPTPSSASSSLPTSLPRHSTAPPGTAPHAAAASPSKSSLLTVSPSQSPPAGPFQNPWSSNVSSGSSSSSSNLLLASPQRTRQNSIRWCRRCRKRKPPMTHHCYVCDRCVLKMDHHCPWMHNCVGLRNYRYFFCFLLYLWLGCGYACAMTYFLLFGERKYPSKDPPSGVVFTFVVSLAVLIAVSLLFFWHVYLVATAQTTIDFYEYRLRRREARKTGLVWVNEFDLGVSRNCTNTFELEGFCWWFYLLIPRTTNVKSDGITFPMKPLATLTEVVCEEEISPCKGMKDRET